MSSTVEVNKDNKQSLSELKHRIATALRTEYNEQAAEGALKHIEKEVEEVENLLDDLECGADNSELVDQTIKCSSIDAKEAHNVLNLLITAVNGDYEVPKTNIPSLQTIFSGADLDVMDVDVDSPSTSKNKNKKNGDDDSDDEVEKKQQQQQQQQVQQLEQTKDWLVQQWDRTFESYSQNKDLLKLFAIGQKQKMPHLPGVLHEVYSQWRINYLIDQKKKRENNSNNNKKARVHPTFNEFVEKSEAFKNLSDTHKQLLKSAINTYGARFSPQPTLPYYAIHDDLYTFVMYTYLMSEAINNLITSSSITLPIQIDFWIIPKQVQDKMRDHDDDDTSDDDDDEQDATDKKEEQKSPRSGKNVIDDESIFNVEQRLRLDKEIKYAKFQVSPQEMAQRARVQRKIQDSISSALQHRRSVSHNRLVCIADRRSQFYDLKVVSEAEDENDQKVPVVAMDDNKMNSKEHDDFYVFQPPGSYGLFPHAYSQEHLQYLSREYMLPSSKVQHPESGHASTMKGVYNDFSHQMFTISFCCHSADDITIQWFVNGRNIRITSLANFTKIWPEFFDASQRDDSLLQQIQTDILSHWTLPITNQEYAQYERDLLRGVPNSSASSSSDDK